MERLPVKKIKQLLDKGYSANSIARKIGKRKQDVLREIRQLQNKPINPVKITNPKGKKGSIALNKDSQDFTEKLYKEGYPITYIARLVNAKYKETSQRKIRAYINQYKTENKEAYESHKTNMKFYQKTGKFKQRQDAKWYFTLEYHYHEPKYQFKTGSPKIEFDEDGEDINEVFSK